MIIPMIISLYNIDSNSRGNNDTVTTNIDDDNNDNNNDDKISKWYIHACTRACFIT